MSRTPPSDTAIRVADLSQNANHTFSVIPSGKEITRLIAELDLSALRKLRFEGSIMPIGKSDWRLEGRLGATVVQPCVVTLEPVTTRIDAKITRQYVQDFDQSDEPEIEMPEDDTTERLTAWIDPATVMQEAMTLAIPDYPRLDSAQSGEMIFTEPGQAPMSDADARPFAGLADLKAQLKPKEN